MSDTVSSNDVATNIVDNIENVIVTINAGENAATTAVENIDTNVVETLVEKTLIQLVENSLTSLDFRTELRKSQINLDDQLINIIKTILSAAPDMFNNIEKAANEIIKDGKIDSKDIPQLIIIVQQIYQMIYSLKNIKLDAKKRSEITGTVLKYFIHLLVLLEKIKIENDKKDQFLKDCDALIDACIGLLSFPKAIKTKGCIKKLFG